MIIDKSLLDWVSSRAKESLRLRMNFNFYQSFDDKYHRMLNAVELFRGLLSLMEEYRRVNQYE